MKARGAVSPEAITAATVQDYMPDAASVQNASRWFADKGFKIEAAGPMSFSISGPVSTFREVLKMRGKSLKKPKDLEDDVEDVAFTPPPDFGPTSY
jgi:hypothetical protein